MHASTLLKKKLNASLISELSKAAEDTGGGSHYLEINGQNVDVDSVDVFTLYALLLQEARSIDSLTELGIPLQEASRLQVISPSSASTFLLDTHTGSENVVWYYNDLETDSRTARWHDSIQELLSRGYPGSFKYIRKNLYTGLLIIDPSRADHLAEVAQVRM